MRGFELYQMRSDGTVRVYHPYTGWVMLDNNPKTSMIVAGDALYQLHNDGKIWRYNGPPITGWEMLDNNPKTKTIVASVSYEPVA